MVSSWPSVLLQCVLEVLQSYLPVLVCVEHRKTELHLILSQALVNLQKQLLELLKVQRGVLSLRVADIQLLD